MSAATVTPLVPVQHSAAVERAGHIAHTFSRLFAEVLGFGNIEVTPKVTPYPDEPGEWKPSASWTVASGVNVNGNEAIVREEDKLSFRLCAVGGFNAASFLQSASLGMQKGYVRWVEGKDSGGKISDKVKNLCDKAVNALSKDFIAELEAFVKANRTKGDTLTTLVVIYDDGRTGKYRVSASPKDEAASMLLEMAANVGAEVVDLATFNERAKLAEAAAKYDGMTPEEKQTEIKRLEKREAAIQKQKAALGFGI